MAIRVRGVCVAQAAENVVSIVENCPILGQAACIYKARDFNRVEGRIGLRSKTDNQKRKKKNKKRSWWWKGKFLSLVEEKIVIGSGKLRLRDSIFNYSFSFLLLLFLLRVRAMRISRVISLLLVSCCERKKNKKGGKVRFCARILRGKSTMKRDWVGETVTERSCWPDWSVKGYRVKQFPENDRERDFSRLFDLLGVPGKCNYYRILLFRCLDIVDTFAFEADTRESFRYEEKI